MLCPLWTGPHPTISLPGPYTLLLCTQRELDPLHGAASRLRHSWVCIPDPGLTFRFISLSNSLLFILLFSTCRIHWSNPSRRPGPPVLFTSRAGEEAQQLVHLLPFQRAKFSAQHPTPKQLSAPAQEIWCPLSSDTCMCMADTHTGIHKPTDKNFKKLKKLLKAPVHLHLLWAIGTGPSHCSVDFQKYLAYEIVFRHYSSLKENLRACKPDTISRNTLFRDHSVPQCRKPQLLIIFLSWGL